MSPNRIVDAYRCERIAVRHPNTGGSELRELARAASRHWPFVQVDDLPRVGWVEPAQFSAQDLGIDLA